MIRRLFVDNYKSLVNFTWEPKAENLVLGYNGSGKTTALDAIDLIRSWVSGWEVLPQLLDKQGFTRWNEAKFIQFQLELETDLGLFEYSAHFDCQDRSGDASVSFESLTLDERRLIKRTGPEIAIYDDENEPVSYLSVSTNQSAVMASASVEHAGLSRYFLAELSRMVVVRPMPPAMQRGAQKPEPRARRRFENFIAWFQHWQQQGNFSREWLGLLNEIWEEFDYLEFEQLGRNETGLNAVFKNPVGPKGEFKLEFQELSDGERMLIVLYALLAYQKAVPATTIVIDEPDNFLAISELQPWLLSMLDALPKNGQLILVSHNAEIMDTMGAKSVSYFSRNDHLSPAKVIGIGDDGSGLSLSERLQLGWIEAPTGRPHRAQKS